MKTKTPRHFTPEEDKLLVTLVAGNTGKTKWSRISAHFPDRTTRQCRERYTLYLSPTLNVEPWTKEEDTKLVKAVNEYGFHWSKMMILFEGRTQMSIKNRWNTHIKKNVHKNKEGEWVFNTENPSKSAQIRGKKFGK